MIAAQIKRDFKLLLDEVRRNRPDFAEFSDEEIIDTLLSELAEIEPNKVQWVGHDLNGQNVWVRWVDE